MDDYVPRTTQTDELAALTAILLPDDAQVAPEPVAPLTPAAALAASAPEAPAAAVVAPTAPAPAAPVAAPEAEAPAPLTPTFEAKLSDELQALLDEPDFDEEARKEVAAEAETDEYEYADPEVAAKLRALEKRNAFLEGQVVAKSKKGWVEEAKRAFPGLALLPGEIEGIDATSRRGFIREANLRNERYKVVLAPVLARVEAERQAIATGAVATAREEVANAWGRPAADTLPPVAAAQQEALAKARQTGRLEESIKVMLETKPVL